MTVMTATRQRKQQIKVWLLLHIYIPTGQHVNSTVLTLVELHQTPALVKTWTCEGWTERGGGWVRWTCVGRKPEEEEEEEERSFLPPMEEWDCLEWNGKNSTFRFCFQVCLAFFGAKRFGPSCPGMFSGVRGGKVGVAHETHKSIWFHCV